MSATLRRLVGRRERTPEEQEIIDVECRMPRAVGFVYFARNPFTNLCKIGISGNLVHRMRELSNSSSIEMILEHVIATDDLVRAESEIHEALVSRNLKGEWFDLDGERGDNTDDVIKRLMETNLIKYTTDAETETAVKMFNLTLSTLQNAAPCPSEDR